VIVKPVFSEDPKKSSRSKRSSTARKSGKVILNEVATTFMFTEEELAGVLAKFGNLNSAANMSPRTKEIFLSSVARKREEGIPLSPATMRTIAALEKKATMGLPKSSGISVKTSSSHHSTHKSSRPRRSTRKASSKPVGGAGGPGPAPRRSTRATTQKKTTSSNTVSPRTLAMIAAMEAASLNGH
jgi:hypothetical protein